MEAVSYSNIPPSTPARTGAQPFRGTIKTTASPAQSPVLKSTCDHSVQLQTREGILGRRSSITARPNDEPSKTLQAGPSRARVSSSFSDLANCGISAWAQGIQVYGPAPPSEDREVSQSTRRAVDNERIVVDGIEREPWEVLTQDAQREDRHEAVSVMLVRRLIP